MAGIDDDPEKLKDFLIRDRFLSISHTELHMYWLEHEKETVHTLAQVADRYLQAHDWGITSHSKLTQNGGNKNCPANHSWNHGSRSNEKRGTGNGKDTSDKICENCNRKGHPQERCWAPGGPDYKRQKQMWKKTWKNWILQKVKSK